MTLPDASFLLSHVPPIAQFSAAVELSGVARPYDLRLGIDLPCRGLLDDLGLARLTVRVPLVAVSVAVSARRRNRSRILALEGRNIAAGDLIQLEGFFLKYSGRLGGTLGLCMIGGSL